MTTWSVVRRIEVLGAPVLFVRDELGSEVSIGEFKYPDGRVKVRIETKAGTVFAMAALAARAAESARKLMMALAEPHGHSVTTTRARGTGSVIVDVDGPESLAIALPFFGQEIVEAWHAAAPPKSDPLA